MRFKKLELLGFKSFAEPTELIFEPGITAIVGPNGCGKSNVADAIKWVLGEQSARELRGGRMEDLIFNGSDHRDPIHYAEVSLTLDNADHKLPIEYSEVQIARRLFRSGESEYLLNGTQVRLKDVHELLMGTGIGTSAYSLFEQGRIEQIISARPEDRREVFEEAAGITKFKSQKREALRKLDETEANLARVSDVIAEVKRQIQSLERAVRRAKTYQEQFDQLKTLEVRVAQHERGRLTAHWQAKEGELESLRSRAHELEAQLGNQEALLGEARDRVAQDDQELNRARESHLSITHAQETTRQRLEVTRERLAEGQARHAKVEEEVVANQAQVVQLRQQQAELALVVAQADTQRQEKEETLIQAQEALNECIRVIEEAQQTIAQAQERLLEETGSQVQLKNALTKVHQEYSRLEARSNRLSLEATKVGAERTEVLVHAQSLEEILSQAKEALEAITRERTLKRENLAASESALGLARQKVGAIEQEMAKVGSQLELLKGLLESHEGYSSGVKALLTALDEGRIPAEGISGVLAELIQVAPKDAPTVDAALGAYAQAVVVESTAVSHRCRQFLESSQAGRVLFLIRDRVPETGTVLTPGKQEPSLNAVSLISRVGITPHLEPLLRLILADTWLVPDRESAEALLQQFSTNHLSTRFVTPVGELFSVASALLGSPPAQEVLVVGRRNRLESLEVSFNSLESQREESQGHLHRLQAEVQTQTQALAALEATTQQRSQELHRIEASYSLAETAFSKLEQELELLKVEQAQADEELKEIRTQLGQAEDQLAQKDETLAKLQASISEAQEKITKASQTREETSVTLAKTQAELYSFDQVVASRHSSLQLLEQTLTRQEVQIKAYQEELMHLSDSQKQWETSCQELENSLSEMSQQGTQAKAEVAQAQTRKAQLFQAAQAKEREFLNLSRSLEQLKAQLHAQEMEQAQLAFQREQIVSRLSQVYQVNLEEATPDPSPVITEEGDLEDVRSQIAELSQKLQRMGPVNLGSIEEERELETRYEYLVTQQNDLLKAKEDLHEAITKINRTTRAMFRETFQAIQQEFQTTFKQLFGGGEARLVLMDEEDLLESGIEIIARPPGKPLQAISLLSGGEKALTTIALLFAIFRVKPSPFCLLDEIDAPLDETNVGRFTDALKEFLKESQFIIITHNKKTITMADVMYGITMEESGVSKIVSVKFKQAANGNGERQVSASNPLGGG